MTNTDFPAGLAERLQRLADDGTAGSRPYPQLDEAMHRAHRRRVTVLSAAASLVLIVAIGLGTMFVPGVLESQDQTPASKDFTAVVEKYPELKQAGYKAPTGGDLGQDQDWLAGLRREAYRQGVADNIPQQYPYHLVPQDILILWAGDVGGARYASVLYPAQTYGFGDDASWTGIDFRGAPGASGADMRRINVFNGDAMSIQQSMVTFNRGVMFVTAPGAKKVELATGRRFLPDGRVLTSWRTLPWPGPAKAVVPVTAAEAALGTIRVDGDERPASPADDVAWPKIDPVATGDLSLVRDALDSVRSGFGAGLAEQPVVGASRSLSPGHLAVAVLRSPDGGYLFGFARKAGDITTYLTASGDRGFGSPGQAMTAVTSASLGREIPGVTEYLVLAPAGATQVRSGTSTALVKNRLALLEVPGAPAPIDVQAFDSQGTVVEAVRSVELAVETSSTS